MKSSTFALSLGAFLFVVLMIAASSQPEQAITSPHVLVFFSSQRCPTEEDPYRNCEVLRTLDVDSFEELRAQASLDIDPARLPVHAHGMVEQFAYSVAISSDGSRVFFVGPELRVQELWSVGVDGKGLRKEKVTLEPWNPAIYLPDELQQGLQTAHRDDIGGWSHDVHSRDGAYFARHTQGIDSTGLCIYRTTPNEQRLLCIDSERVSAGSWLPPEDSRY